MAGGALSLEDRILSVRSIYVWAMPPFVAFIVAYIALTSDNGITRMPWALVVAGCVPTLAVLDVLGARLMLPRLPHFLLRPFQQEGDSPEEVRNRITRIGAFMWACVFSAALLATTGGYRSLLWVFLLLPILGSGAETASLGMFIITRIIIGLVLLSGWLPFVQQLALSDWLNLILINVALNVVGLVVWFLVNRERRQRIAVERAEAQLLDINQHLEERVARQVEEIESARQLQRYLSPQLAQAIMAGEVLALSTTRKEATVFFSDIRGFTALSEQLEPEELIQMMNEYLSSMTEIVFRFDGTLDKYIGDAIMVFFNDPAPQPDHALRCVRMALAMRARLAELQSGWFAQGSEPLSIGIGINTGYVTVGTIGSASRMEYTVLGNNVNLASRLCSAAEAGQILVSHKTQGLIAGQIETRLLREEAVKGTARPVKLYEVLAPAAEPVTA